MSSTTVAVSPAVSPSVSDYHFIDGVIAAHVMGSIVLYYDSGEVLHVCTGAKSYGHESVFYLDGLSSRNMDPDIFGVLVQAGLPIFEAIIVENGTFIILHGRCNAMDIDHAFSTRNDFNTVEVPVVDLSKTHGAGSDLTSTLVALTWERPTRCFYITALDKSSHSALRAMAAKIHLHGFPFLGPNARVELGNNNFGPKLLLITGAFETASERELCEFLFGTKDYDKTRFAMGTGPSSSDSIMEQLVYVNDILEDFGDLEMTVKTHNSLIDNTTVRAVATFADPEAAAKAAGMLMDEGLPFAKNSRLDIRQVHQHDVLFPTESSWRLASDFCSSDEYKEFTKNNECHMIIDCDAVNLRITCQSVNRRAALQMRRKLIQFAQPTTPQTPSGTGGTDTRTCVICSDDDCSVDSTVTGACGHSYCLECFSNCISAGMWTKDGGIRCAAAEENTVCGKTFTLSVMADQVPRELFVGILTTSLDAHVDKKPDWLQRCPEPDCSHIYEPAPWSPHPTPRHCGDCGVFLCRTCGEEHPESDECPRSYDVELQKALDEVGARGCPNCRVPIEKNEGCNHMTCPVCDVHICWSCMAMFREARAVYKHMVEEHRRIGDGPRYLDLNPDGTPVVNEAMLAEQFQVEEQAQRARMNEVDDE